MLCMYVCKVSKESLCITILKLTKQCAILQYYHCNIALEYFLCHSIYVTDGRYANNKNLPTPALVKDTKKFSTS
jgi:hypothetical protein